MTEAEAIARYFTYNKKARKTVERIMAWDENRTARNNAIAMNSSTNSMGELRVRYKLKCQREERRRKMFWNGNRWAVRKPIEKTQWDEDNE